MANVGVLDLVQCETSGLVPMKEAVNGVPVGTFRVRAVDTGEKLFVGKAGVAAGLSDGGRQLMWVGRKVWRIDDEGSRAHWEPIPSTMSAMSPSVGGLLSNAESAALAASRARPCIMSVADWSAPLVDRPYVNMAAP